MRDWKVFRPESGGSVSSAESSGPPPLIRKRRSEVDPAVDEPQFEIELDMNTEQLTLMFDDAVKYEQRSSTGPIDRGADYQEQWRRQALDAKAHIAETFGEWSDTSRVEGSTYHRKVTRLG